DPRSGLFLFLHGNLLMRRDKSVHPENIYAILPFFDASLQGHFVNFVCFFAKDCDGRVTKAGGTGIT
ncbi:MAG: hypothetical protein IIW07_03435, partial [Clostridia bacterium]|nr:hypothetical protein [Clostridia bacterium]